VVTLEGRDPIVGALLAAIRGGDLEALDRLLAERPELASARIVDDKGGSRTPLHIATDWPGHFPNGPAAVRVLLEAGADPNASVEGSWHSETPLYWAASSDDVEVLDALLDGGADIEAQGASIAGGSPLDDAVGYGQWGWPAGWSSGAPRQGCGMRPRWACWIGSKRRSLIPRRRRRKR
jgi:uncharacterized protein